MPSRARGARIHRAASNHLKTTTSTAATTVRRTPAPVMRPRRNSGSGAGGVAVLVRAADAHEPVADGVAGAAFDSEHHQHVNHSDANGDAAQQHQHRRVVNDEAAALRAGDAGKPDGEHHHQQRCRPHPVEHRGAQAPSGRRGNQVQLATHSGTSPLYVRVVRLHTAQAAALQARVGGALSGQPAHPLSVGRLPECRPGTACPGGRSGGVRPGLRYGDTTGNRAAMRGGPLHQLPLRVVDVPLIAGGPVGQRGAAGRAERRSGTYQLLAALAALGVMRHGSLRFSLKSRLSTVWSSSGPESAGPDMEGPAGAGRQPGRPVAWQGGRAPRAVHPTRGLRFRRPDRPESLELERSPAVRQE